MDYLVKIRSVQTPLNGQFSIGANNTLPMPFQAALHRVNKSLLSSYFTSVFNSLRH